MPKTNNGSSGWKTKHNQYYAFELLLQTSQHSKVVRVTDCKTEGAGSIPDGIATVFAAYADYQRTIKGSLQEPFKVLLRTLFFWECGFNCLDIYSRAIKWIA